MMQQQTISIIGTGALGHQLVHSLHRKGWSVKSLYNRHKNVALDLADELKASHAGVFPQKMSELGKIIFLTVPDHQIPETASRLAALNQDFSDYVVVHCSGTQTSEILNLFQQRGAAVASFHPIQTFTALTVTDIFDDIYIDMEGDERALECLKKIARDLNAHPLLIETSGKPYVHAASVMASNYVLALMEAASRIAKKGGLSRKQALHAFTPLARQSLTNISVHDNLADALSGPILRGDTETVARHMDVLKSDGDLQVLYQRLGRILVELATNGAAISPIEAEELMKSLKLSDDDQE